MYPHGHLIIQEGYLTFNYPTQEIKEWQKRKKKQSSKVKVLIENFPRSHWMVFIYLSGFCWFAGDGREHNLLIGYIATLHRSQGADSVTKNQSMLVSFYCHNLIQPRITCEEGTLAEELSCSDWPVRMEMGISSIVNWCRAPSAQWAAPSPGRWICKV